MMQKSLLVFRAEQKNKKDSFEREKFEIPMSLLILVGSLGLLTKSCLNLLHELEASTRKKQKEKHKFCNWMLGESYKAI